MGTGVFDHGRNRLPAPAQLTPKPGAQAMAVKNDNTARERRWVNGSVGTVDRLTSDRVWVRIDHRSSPEEVECQTWEKIRHYWDESRKCVETEVVGSYTQAPITLAWAASIHKAQE